MRCFEVKDCALLTRMSSIPAVVSLRDLRDAIARCNESVLYHHFCETLMVPCFDNPDYRNDFAVWANQHLGDKVLAERLGMIDPYLFSNMEQLRFQVLEVIDERLRELPEIPEAAPDSAFHFLEATTIVFDTWLKIEHPRELGSAIQSMTNSSMYFHFLEARRRPPFGFDDFSTWLADWGPRFESTIQRLVSVDFMFLTLAELRLELVSKLATENERT